MALVSRSVDPGQNNLFWSLIAETTLPATVAPVKSTKPSFDAMEAAIKAVSGYKAMLGRIDGEVWDGPTRPWGGKPPKPTRPEDYFSWTEEDTGFSSKIITVQGYLTFKNSPKKAAFKLTDANFVPKVVTGQDVLPHLGEWLTANTFRKKSYGFVVAKQKFTLARYNFLPDHSAVEVHYQEI